VREDVNIRGSWVKHIREFSVLVSQFVYKLKIILKQKAPTEILHNKDSH